MAIPGLLLAPIAIAVSPVGMMPGHPDESQLKGAFPLGFARSVECTDATEISLCSACDAGLIRDIAPDLSQIRVLTVGPRFLDSGGTLEFIRTRNNSGGE